MSKPVVPPKPLHLRNPRNRPPTLPPRPAVLPRAPSYGPPGPLESEFESEIHQKISKKTEECEISPNSDEDYPLPPLRERAHSLPDQLPPSPPRFTALRSPAQTRTTISLDTSHLARQEPDKIDATVAGKLPSGLIDSLGEGVYVAQSGGKLAAYSLNFQLLSDISAKYRSLAVCGSDQLWCGAKDGSVQVLSARRLTRHALLQSAHIRPVTHMWASATYEGAVSLSSEDGKLNVWAAPAGRSPPLRPLRTMRVVPGAEYATFGSLLWLTRGRHIYIYDPFLLTGSFQPVPALVLPRDPAKGNGTLGDITCITANAYDTVIVGHNDGTLTLIHDWEVIGTVKVGIHAITQVTNVPQTRHYWVGTRSGSLAVLDINMETVDVPQAAVLYQWKAHATGIQRMVANRHVALTGDLKSLVVWNVASLEARTRQRPTQLRRPLNVRVLSWNLDASTPDQLQTRVLQEPVIQSGSCDILVVGFQEIVELESKSQTARNILSVPGDSYSLPEYSRWREYLRQLYEPLGLELVASRGLVGLYSCVFVHHSLSQDVSELEMRTVKTGMGGRYGNKGSVIARFKLAGASLAFVNCHLAAGHTSIVQRNRDAEQIVRESGAVTDNDYCFFFGDTNYRISVAREHAESLVGNRDWEKLRKHDQLTSQLAKNPTFCLAMFQEAPIAFAPTYKFDRGADTYDTSDKKRIPAWCDRVLYRGPGIRVNSYNSLTTFSSDHRPVFGAFFLPATS